MCMSRVSNSFFKRLFRKYPTSGIGYKVFLIIEGTLHSPGGAEAPELVTRATKELKAQDNVTAILVKP